MKRHKFYMRKKGRYKDGRIRYILEWTENRNIKSIAVPKPEKLKEILDAIKKTTKFKEDVGR